MCCAGSCLNMLTRFVRQKQLDPIGRSGHTPADTDSCCSVDVLHGQPQALPLLRDRVKQVRRRQRGRRLVALRCGRPFVSVAAFAPASSSVEICHDGRFIVRILTAQPSALWLHPVMTSPVQADVCVRSSCNVTEPSSLDVPRTAPQHAQDQPRAGCPDCPRT